MKNKSGFLVSVLVISSFVLSACMGLIPLEQEPAAAGGYGPKASPQEQQTKTFEALWQDLSDNYIYFETANVDWKALHDKYLQRIQSGLSSEEFASLIKELGSELPAGSLVYESRPERIQNETTDSSSYEGIGAFIGFSREPTVHMVLLDVIKGSPAEKAGLKAHDSILKIDGKPILPEEEFSSVNRLRGKAGSIVTLAVQSPGQAERSVEVKRGKLSTIGKLQAEIIPGTNFGYLLFPPLGYDTLEGDVKKALQTLTADQQLDGLVLDLRIANSAGGWPLRPLYAMFGSGTLAEIYDRSNKQSIEVQGQDVFNSQKIPLVILTGQNTTGFPEVLAAGLQLHKRAVVIGEQTPGAVEATTAFYLPDGSQVYIASTSFRLLPGGEDLGTTGVTPDIPLPSGWDQVAPNQDPVLDRAIEYLDGQK